MAIRESIVSRKLLYRRSPFDCFSTTLKRTLTIAKRNPQEGTSKTCISGGLNMYKILAKQELAPQIKLVKIDAPDIAEKAKPGQFVIIRIDEKGERIPLTLADWDREEGSVTVACMEVGPKTTRPPR